MNISFPKYVIPVVALVILLGLIGGVIILFSHGKNTTTAQAETCPKVSGQSCEQIACVGDQKGSGTCNTGNFCCKVIKPTIVQENSVTMISDVKNLRLSNVDQASLIQIANELNLLNNPNVSFHDVHQNLVKGTVTSLAIRVTNISGAPLYYHDGTILTTGADQTASGYGDTFDSRIGHLTIFLYYSDELLQKFNTQALQTMFWHTTLMALYETVHSLPFTDANEQTQQNTFINSHIQSVPFAVIKL